MVTIVLSLEVLLAAASARAVAAPLFPNPQFVADRLSISSVLVGDFNGDSKPDLVVASGGPIWVFLGLGGGEFGPKIVVPVGGGDFNFTTAIAIGDFNGDQVQDLAAANSGSNDLSVVLGNGDGSFQPETRVPTLGQQPLDVAAGDLNGDGRDDLVATNSSLLEESISVHLRQANGTFVSSRIVVGQSPLRVAIGDFNRDGRADLAVGGRDADAPDPGTSGYLAILLGNGDGTFASGQRFTTTPLFERSGVTLGDVDDDGSLDVLMLAGSAGGVPSLAVFLGHRNGTFDRGPDVAGCCNARVSIGDLNGDGSLDLVGGAVQAFLGLGDGSFTALPAAFPPFGGSTALADFDHDGHLDLVMSSVNTVFRGRGDGTFALLDTYQRSVAGAMISDDLNKDGETDILFGHGNVILVPGIGGGRLGSQVVVPVGNTTVAVAVGDFNGDGRKDLVTANATRPLPVGSYVASVLLGNGDLTFQSPVTYSVGDVPAHVAVGDFNGDGRDDFVVANGSSNDVSVLLGNGDGTFAPQVRYPVGTSPRFVVAADFDSDGREDLAVANNSSLDISVLLGNGDGTFGAEARFGAGGKPTGLATGDFNDDGKTDLAVSDRPGSTGSMDFPDAVCLLFGAADGTFGPATAIGVGNGPSVPIVADFDSDGRDDLALAWSWTYTVSVFLGAGAAGLGPESRFAVWTRDPIALAATDFDKDGFSDLYVASSFGTSGFIAALPNQSCLSCNHALDVAIDTVTPAGKGAATVLWRTDRESTLAGFNVVVFDSQGNRTQQNLALIPCEGCVDLAGYSYAFPVSKHKSARNIFVEVVHRDGNVVLFGPAMRQ
jgi:hypothetical protein